MIDLKKNTLLREIPDNLLADPKVENLAKSLQQSLDAMLDWSDKINYTLNLHTLDDEVLDHILWEKHITYSEGLALAINREHKINLIQNAIALHRLKGTPAGLELAFSLLDVDCKLTEWFEYEGEPYHFKLDILLRSHGLTEDMYKLFSILLREYKNVRSWLDAITLLASVKSSIYVCAATLVGESHVVYPYTTDPADVVDDLYISANTHHYETEVVYPKQ